MPSRSLSPSQRVFLNIPYAKKFEPIYIAYIDGLAEFGLTPVATLQIATGQTRVDRIFDLLQSCRFSIHDLSWTGASGNPRLPRFNMPLEPGLAAALDRQAPQDHTWIAFDSVRYQAQRTLSDLAGSDFNIHANSPRGVMNGLCSVFVAKGNPSVPDMLARYQVVFDSLRKIKRASGATSLYEARIFSEIVQAAQDAAVSPHLPPRPV